MRNRWRIPLGVMLLAGLTGRAAACGTCAYAMMRVGFPPSWPWSFLIPVWFLLQNVIEYARCNHDAGRGGGKEKTNFIPPVVRWLVIPVLVFLVAVVLGSIAFGPLLLLFLVFPAVYRFVLYLWSVRSAGSQVSPVFRNRTLALGALMLVLLGVTGVWETATIRRMSEADIIVMGVETPVERIRMSALKQREPNSATIYRDLLRRPEVGLFTQKAAEGLARINQPAEDVPLIIDALARVRADSSYNRLASEIENSLRQLSGLKPPADTAVAEWRRLWQSRNRQASLNPAGR